MRVAIVGGGAAGCFCAAEIKLRRPDAEVVVYEAGVRPLAKVAASGGGRCNFTNTFEGLSSIDEAYPRGANLMKRLLQEFGPEDARAWFERRGVPSVAQDDCRVFPESQHSEDVVDALLGFMRKSGIKLVCGRRIRSLDEMEADAIIVTTGGRTSQIADEPQKHDYLLTGIQLEKCVPSLFAFRINDKRLSKLAGISVPGASLGFTGTKFRSNGDLLVTGWGISGPATLKLSSYAAPWLAEQGYKAELLIGWTGMSEEEVRSWIEETAEANPKKKVTSVSPSGIPSRLWKFILERNGIDEGKIWSELGPKKTNRLASVLTADSYHVSGRSPYKAEFVTCGGVSLQAVNPATLECRTHPGLFFAGEVLDIDAITGGFNLQAAWSTAYVAARAVCDKYKER